MTQPLARRKFLKGLGTAIALPWLETLAPTRLLGAASKTGPTRLAFVYVPNGANMADWIPSAEGATFDLPYILEPLRPVRSQFQVLTGLAQRKADPNGDGGGDHARASATFLTGMQARKTAAVDIQVGVSVDQLAANGLAGQTRLPSLELGCDKGQQAGSCDSGYSCAYQFNLAWRNASSPLPPEVDPRLVFDRLFTSGSKNEIAESRQRRRERSILDFVQDDARQLQGKLGTADRHKLNDYLDAVREIERRIELASRLPAPETNYPRPDSVPESYPEHIRILFDLLALAFQTDSTRVATFMLAHDGSNRSYPFAGVGEGHHDLSHHGGNAEKKAKIARINRFHVEQFGYFLEKLQSIQDGDATLLDRSMIVYGSGIADGNAHTHHDLPVLLAGAGNGTLTPGRHVRFPKETPMTNLYLSLLERMQTPAARLGDSTGPLPGLV